jgi:pimeloyl-ACP methyl ester carboxylesterase
MQPAMNKTLPENASSDPDGTIARRKQIIVASKSKMEHAFMISRLTRKFRNVSVQFSGQARIIAACIIAFYSIASSAADERPSVVILIHGVLSGGLAGEDTYSYAKFRDVASQHLGMAELIDFDYSHGRPDQAFQAAFRVGHRADQISGISNTSWAGIAKLKELVGRIRLELGDLPAINLVAHSQGSLIALGAIQEGLQVDNVVFMGSPLSQKLIQTAADECLLAKGARNVKGLLKNLYSRDDLVVNNLKPAVNLLTPDGCIGGRGLPSQVAGLENDGVSDRCRYWKLLDGRRCVACLEVAGVDHNGPNGWWSASWLKTDQSSELIGLLASKTAIGRELSSIHAFAGSSEFNSATRNGFGASDGNNQAEWIYHLFNGTESGFHFDDKRVIDYELEVLRGEVEVRVKHATFFDWELNLEPDAETIRAADGIVRRNFRSANRIMDATLYLQLTSTAPMTVVRCKAVASR